MSRKPARWYHRGNSPTPALAQRRDRDKLRGNPADPSNDCLAPSIVWSSRPYAEFAEPGRDRFARLYKSLRRAQPDRIVRAPDGDDKDVFVLCQCTHRNNVGGIARDLIYPLGEGGHIAQVTDCRSDAVSALRRFIRYHLARFTACTKDNNPAHSFLLHPGTGCSSNRERIGFRVPT